MPLSMVDNNWWIIETYFWNSGQKLMANSKEEIVLFFKNYL